LRFFFGVTLDRPEAFDRIISAKEPKKLPVVLSGRNSIGCTAHRRIRRDTESDRLRLSPVTG
jgi:hypothetical protein